MKMFILYRVHASKRNESGHDKEIVETSLSTVEEARETAWESGPGRYIVVSLSRAPGHRVVERIRVPASACEMGTATLTFLGEQYD